MAKSSFFIFFGQELIYSPLSLGIPGRNIVISYFYKLQTKHFTLSLFRSSFPPTLVWRTMKQQQTMVSKWEEDFCPRWRRWWIVWRNRTLKVNKFMRNRWRIMEMLIVTSWINITDSSSLTGYFHELIIFFHRRRSFGTNLSWNESDKGTCVWTISIFRHFIPFPKGSTSCTGVLYILNFTSNEKFFPI